MFDHVRMPPLAALAAAAAAIGAGPAPASDQAPGEGLHCRGEMHDTLAPGVGLQPGPSDIRTSAPGTLTCRGSWNGARATGGGTYTMVARFSDQSSCAGGSARGLFTFLLDTTAGRQRISAPFTFTFFELPRRGGLLGGTFQSPHFTGGFDVTPTAGNCVTEPVTADHAICEFDFGAEEAGRRGA